MNLIVKLQDYKHNRLHHHRHQLHQVVMFTLMIPVQTKVLIIKENGFMISGEQIIKELMKVMKIVRYVKMTIIVGVDQLILFINLIHQVN